MTTTKDRLNIPLEDGAMDRYKAQARAAGFSTLSEYVRHVLDGRHQVVPLAAPVTPTARGRGRPKRRLVDVLDFRRLVAELGDSDIAAQVAEFGSFEALVLDAFEADDQTRILHAAIRVLGLARAREVFPGCVRLGGGT